MPRGGVEQAPAQTSSVAPPTFMTQQGMILGTVRHVSPEQIATNKSGGTAAALQTPPPHEAPREQGARERARAPAGVAAAAVTYRPFTPYRMMHGIANLDVDLWRVSFYGVDDSGREWRVDPYAWEAIPDWHLQLCVVTAFKKLPPEQKQQTVEILFAQAERYRAATISRGRLPYPSFLGPFSAAQLWMFDREAAVSPNPYRGFRIYREDWTGRSRMAKPPVDKRVLIAERGRI